MGRAMTPDGRPIRMSGRPRCGVSGKEMWDTAKAAISAMAAKGITGALRAYRCPFCEAYHQTGSGNRPRKNKGRTR